MGCRQDIRRKIERCNKNDVNDDSNSLISPSSNHPLGRHKIRIPHHCTERLCHCKLSILEEGKWKTELKEIDNDTIPDLEVYIINVWPSKEENLPSDYDGVKDRYNDIRYNDKTKYDQTVT